MRSRRTCSFAMLTMAVSATVLVTASCKTSSGAQTEGATDKASQSADGGLDVNDVSFLFPLPDLYTDAGKLLSPSLLNADNKPILSESLFKDVISHYKYTALIDGNKVPLNANIAFDKKDRNIVYGPKSLPGPFDNYADWKVVGMRFDPCSPTAEHNLAKKPAQKTFPLVTDAACQPQIRVTIQPVLSPTAMAFEFRAGMGKPTQSDSVAPYVADYAMHLVYALQPSVMQDFYNDLVAFKKSCGDLTSGVSLAVHPCLMAEKFAGNYAGPHFQAVAGLIKKYATNLSAIASMATRANSDPWLFMDGAIKDDKFIHLPISAVRKDASDGVKVNAAGKTLEPFSNGYYQMLSFLDATAGEKRTDISTRVVPAAVPSKTNANIDTGLDRMDLSGQNPAFLQALASIANPLQNDFFSSDCVSCHEVANASNYLQLKDVAGLTDFFKAEGTYTSALSRSSLPDAVESKPLRLIQFGYINRQAIVGPRVANESVKVATQANLAYGGGSQPNHGCKNADLQACFETSREENLDDDTLRIKDSRPLARINYCMEKTCPARALQLRAYFGPDAQRTYTAKSDLKILSVRNNTYMQKGTVFVGLVRRQPERYQKSPVITQILAGGPLWVMGLDGKPRQTPGNVVIHEMPEDAFDVAP